VWFWLQIVLGVALLLGIPAAFLGLIYLFLQWSIRRRFRYSLERIPPALAAHETDLRDLARPCIRFRSRAPAKGTPDDPLASKFGGIPYLAPDEDWPPSSTGRPMALVAQINFERLAGELKQSGQTMPRELPSRGVLQCFGEFADNAFTAQPWVVRWIDDASAPPQDVTLPDLPHGAPRRRLLEARLGWSLPHPDDEVNPPTFVLGDNRLLDAYEKVAVGLGGFHGGHQLLGYADWLQGDGRSQRGPGEDSSVEDPPSWRLLWQISDEDAVALGDGGILYILIHEDDLAAGRLDEVEAFSDQS